MSPARSVAAGTILVVIATAMDIALDVIIMRTVLFPLLERVAGVLPQW